MYEGLFDSGCLIYVRSMISFDSVQLIAADGHKDGRAHSRKIKFITLLL